MEAGSLTNGSLARLGACEANQSRTERDLREFDRENSEAHRRIHEELSGVKTGMATTGTTLEHLVKAVERIDTKLGDGFTKQSERADKQDSRITTTIWSLVGASLTGIALVIAAFAHFS